MRCEECQPLIEPYFDGALEELSAGLVARHLESCASCASLQPQLEIEQSFYLRHEPDVEVPAAFWLNVFERVARERTVRAQRSFAAPFKKLALALMELRTIRLGPLATTALLLLTIGSTAMVMRYLSSRDGSESPETSNRAAATATPASTATNPGQSESGKSSAERGVPSLVKTDARTDPQSGGHAKQDLNTRLGGSAGIRSVIQATGAARRQTPDQLVREAEQKYLAAIAMLSRDTRGRRQLLDPDARAQLEQTLAVVDRAIANTRQAVRTRPGDPVAVQYMLAAYSKKVDVLRQLVND